MEMNKQIAGILRKCQGKSEEEILKRAAKLTAKDRVQLIAYFSIEPQHLAGSIIYFWLTPSKVTTEVSRNAPVFFK